MKRSDALPQSLADILEKSSKRFKFSQGVREYRLRKAWTRAVGPAIAQQAQPVRFARGVLTVAVRSSVWLQELQMMIPEILERIRRHPTGRAVDKIRLRIGSVEPGERPVPGLAERLSKVELDKEVLLQIDRLCATVVDLELRSIIRRVAEKDARLRRLQEIEKGPTPESRPGAKGAKIGPHLLSGQKPGENNEAGSS